MLSAIIVVLAGALTYALTRPTSPTSTNGIMVAQSSAPASPKPMTELDRATALAALRANASTLDPEETTETLILQKSTGSERDALSAYLISRGMVACTTTTPQYVKETACALTGSGNAQHWKTVAVDGGCYKDCPVTKVTVPLADVVVEQVTGIQLLQNQATAHFTYHIEPNALGHSLLGWIGHKHFCGTDYPATWGKGTQQNEAAFEQFDDGWRFSGVSSAAAFFDPNVTLCNGL